MSGQSIYRSISGQSANYIYKAERRKKSIEQHNDNARSQSSFVYYEPDPDAESSSGKRENEEEQCDTKCICDWDLPLCFTNTRYSKDITTQMQSNFSINSTPCWRKKGRLRTVGVALVLCLNVGVDPPDSTRQFDTNYNECWIYLNLYSANKAVEVVGKMLQQQYEKYQPRARFRYGFDPTIDEVKKICTTLRRNAKTDRLLFHYNGHGVPKPTENGEIWVFDRKYTKYVPVSLYDIHTWISGPTIFVYDCNYAGLAVEGMEKFRMQRVAEYQRIVELGAELPPSSITNNLIQLGACGKTECLPIGFHLPADLFSCCLTSPVKAALHWFLSKKNNLLPHITAEMIQKIPGNLKDRHSPLGELNWIFVAITDTIAWMTFRGDPDKFQTYFREDLLVASIMRNYLLAERVMNSFGICTVTSPELSSTWDNRLWDLWDLVVDQCVWQLPVIIEDVTKYVNNNFFSDQLTALDVWFASGLPLTEPPDQLPILLQVLLNIDYRDKALYLLEQFLALGTWAVIVVLEAGFLPILLKLLQSLTADAHPVIVLIWAKIMGFDSTSQVDLVKEDCHKYFIDVVGNYELPARYVTAATYVLANIMYQYPTGQIACFREHLLSICLDRLYCSDSVMRQWCAICLGLLWTNYEAAHGCGIRDGAPDKLSELLTDPSPETRAATVYALGKLISNKVDLAAHSGISFNHSHSIGGKLGAISDGSPLVRKELIIAFYGMIIQSENAFITAIAAFHDETYRGMSMTNAYSIEKFQGYLSERRDSRRDSRRGSQLSESGMCSLLNTNRYSEPSKISCCGNHGDSGSCEYLKSHSSHSAVTETIYTKIYGILVKLADDPDFEVADMALRIVSTLHAKAFTCLTCRPQFRNRFTSICEEGLHSEIDDVVLFSKSPSRPSLMDVLSFPPKARIPIEPLKESPDVASSNEESKIKMHDPTLDNPFLKQLIGSTKFFEWCKTEFAISLTKPLGISRVELDSREWRFMRNTKVRVESKRYIVSNPPYHLEEECFMKKNVHSPGIVKFNPFVPHLLSADRQGLSVWNYETKSKLNYFLNRNLKDFKICSMDIVNAHDIPLLLIGSDEGNIRVWKDYDDDRFELVTAWCVLPLGITNHKSLGLVTEWEQQTGTLLASGKVEMVRLWDIEKEMKIMDTLTKSHHHVTCIKGDPSNKSLFVIGLGDGSVQLMDRRLSPTESCAMKMHEHANCVINVFLREKDNESIVSASANGDIKFWDIRMMSSVYTIERTQSYLPVMDIHDQADLIACGSLDNGVKVINYKGEILSEIQYHSGIIGQKVGPVCSLSFHPYWTHLAIGTTDSIVSAYSHQKLAPLCVEDLICSECVY